MAQKIKFAVIGYGHIGKRHAEMIRNNANTELLAICDIKPTENTDAIKELYFNSFEDLVAANLDIDVINICVPNGLHSHYALKALSHNKHVVVEKPIALTRHDAEKMIAKSQKVSRHIFCVMQNRYALPSQWLKKVVSEKTIGDVLMVQINCFWNRDERYYNNEDWHGTADLDGGTLFTQFSHFIDIMYWLFGDISNIQGNFKDFKHKDLTAFEDSGIVNFDFINGGIGAINYSTAINKKNFESSITIIGSKGTAKVAGQYMDKIEYCEIEGYDMPELHTSNTVNNTNHNLNYVIENVVDKLKHEGNITTDVVDGMKIVDIIERIYQVRDKQGY